MINVESVSNCIKTVAFEMKWPPNIFDKMYLDDFDKNGLFFWYNEILMQISLSNK